MVLQLGDFAPDFVQESTAGQVHFYEYIGDGWAVLFSHPKDFTPVCTTELGAAARLKPEFDRRGVKLLGLSVDALRDHVAWQHDILTTQGHALNFPLLADASREVARAYGMIHPEVSDTFTVRSVFIIGPGHKIRAILTYPASTGRNFDEILRLIDSLQLTDRYSVATPANWKNGDDVIIVPSLTDKVAREKFPGGWTTVTPYLRVVPQPRA